MDLNAVYTQGFVDKCACCGVDPKQLIAAPKESVMANNRRNVEGPRASSILNKATGGKSSKEAQDAPKPVPPILPEGGSAKFMKRLLAWFAARKNKSALPTATIPTVEAPKI